MGKLLLGLFQFQIQTMWIHWIHLCPEHLHFHGVLEAPAQTDLKTCVLPPPQPPNPHPLCFDHSEWDSTATHSVRPHIRGRALLCCVWTRWPVCTVSFSSVKQYQLCRLFWGLNELNHGKHLQQCLKSAFVLYKNQLLLLSSVLLLLLPSSLRASWTFCPALSPPSQ